MLRATSLAVARGRALLGRRCLCSAAEYAVAPYRNMARMTAQQRDAFAAADVLLHQKMRELVPAALAHNGEEAFDAHLVGVQSVLRSWDAPEHLCNAALFHSIYGTEGFQGFKLPLTHRDEISQLIGADAERLAWIFCMVDRASVDATVLAPQADNAPPSFFARAELGGFRIRLQSEQEWIDFLTLSLADWLEQVEGAASKECGRPTGDRKLWPLGTAWAYRRDAYKAMSELLGARGVSAAPRMHAEVFAREGSATKYLVQPLTPPMSEGAIEAIEALASAEFDAAAKHPWVPVQRPVGEAIWATWLRRHQLA